MHIHLLIEQKWSDVDKIDSGLVFIFEFERVLKPSDNLIVLLLLFGGYFFQKLQERFVLKEHIINIFNALFYLRSFAIIRERLRILFKELQLLFSLLFVFCHLVVELFVNFQTKQFVYKVLLILLLKIVRAISGGHYLLLLLSLHLIIVNWLALDFLFLILTIFLNEFLVFFYLLSVFVEELAIFPFTAISCLRPKLTWLFCLCLMNKRTVLLHTFTSAIVPANFSFLWFLHKDFTS